MAVGVAMCTYGGEVRGGAVSVKGVASRNESRMAEEIRLIIIVLKSYCIPHLT